MLTIEYYATDIRDIELIRPLWVQLNEYHHNHAKTFQDHYEQMTFDERKSYFENVASIGSLRIDLAIDQATERYIGYCITSLSQENMGEIESIFIEEGYRSQGIGSVLVSRAFTWLNANGSARNRVSVADGNEAAFEFYRKFGFYPRITVLEQRRE